MSIQYAVLEPLALTFALAVAVPNPGGLHQAVQKDGRTEPTRAGYELQPDTR